MKYVFLILAAPVVGLGVGIAVGYYGTWIVIRRK
jgi:ABC-type microcin C transport system permease subunit YejE